MTPFLHRLTLDHQWHAAAPGSRWTLRYSDDRGIVCERVGKPPRLIVRDGKWYAVRVVDAARRVAFARRVVVGEVV